MADSAGPIEIENFSGLRTQPDPTIVTCRFSRNVRYGPSGSWVETRPGTEHMAAETAMGADIAMYEQDEVYCLQDDRFNGKVLVYATPQGAGELGVAGGIEFAPFGVAQVTGDTGPPGIPSYWLMASQGSAGLSTINRTTYALATVESTATNYRVLCTDGMGVIWVGKIVGTGMTIHAYTSSGLGASIGTVTNANRVYAVPKMMTTGCYIMAAGLTTCVFWNVTASAVTSMGTPTGVTFGASATNFRNIDGLAWCIDGDFLIMGERVGTPSTYGVVKCSVASPPAARSNYPANTAVEYAPASTSFSSCLQLGPSGFHYAFLDAGSTAATQRIAKFTAGSGGVSGLATVVETADVAVYQCAFAVLYNGDVGFVYETSEGQYVGGLRDVSVPSTITLDLDGYSVPPTNGIGVFGVGTVDCQLGILGGDSDTLVPALLLFNADGTLESATLSPLASQVGVSGATGAWDATTNPNAVTTLVDTAGVQYNIVSSQWDGL